MYLNYSFPLMPIMPQSHSDLQRSARRKIIDRQRPSAARRGYGRRWQRYRLSFLAEHPICDCGCGHPSTDLDHIIPATGPDDPLFWDPDNHQALTHKCHSKKTMKEVQERYHG